jgi:hypothetical protein
VATITITATVDEADLAAFLVSDPDIHGAMRARLNEVFGEDGAVLTTIDVQSVETGDADPEDCDHEAITCLECGSQAV